MHYQFIMANDMRAVRIHDADVWASAGRQWAKRGHDILAAFAPDARIALLEIERAKVTPSRAQPPRHQPRNSVAALLVEPGTTTRRRASIRRSLPVRPLGERTRKFGNMPPEFRRPP